MITVFIYEDDEYYQERYSRMLEAIALEQQMYLSITVFDSADKLIEVLKAMTHCPTVIYLGVEVKSMNGLELGNRLREQGVNSEIIFISNATEYVFDTFEIGPSNFLIKDRLTCDGFKTEFLNAVEKYRPNREQIFAYQIKGTTYAQRMSKIVSIEIKKRIIILNINDGQTIEFYGTMYELDQQIRNTVLVRVHRSYIVNITYIDSYDKTTITLKDGTEIPIGKYYMTVLENEYIAYVGSHR
ncbi:response regulator transcription factor [Erysipelothrix sp. HDW6B]|uniref:LytR/AlgR family response regulator transcription factor n=1 Tax=Erysipelothrix TaxID=1647 RepID=UPI0013584F1D|nr:MULTISPECIES: LytTR family DNA-binding domain-containing protein [Erysipelothrix]QIK86688.1 response regulator transcription factor [Erysipelothrix sp. HDW6B]